MLETTILAVGKLRSYYREACDEYAKRLRRMASVQEFEVREGRGNTAEEIEQDEGSRLLQHMPKRSVLVALTRDGSSWTSKDLAGRLERWSFEARPVSFAIGGSTGLSKTLLADAQFRWSLGPLTLPHELARVVVYEQLYRGFSILRNEPYHKGKG